MEESLRRDVGQCFEVLIRHKDMIAYWRGVKEHSTFKAFTPIWNAIEHCWNGMQYMNYSICLKLQCNKKCFYFWIFVQVGMLLLKTVHSLIIWWQYILVVEHTWTTSFFHIVRVVVLVPCYGAYLRSVFSGIVPWRIPASMVRSILELHLDGCSQISMEE